MILKKPYAFFIKMFKPIHGLLAVLIGYLIYIETDILNYFNKYIYSSISGINISIDRFITIIPLIIIFFSLLILGVMYKKDKPFTFYLINIFIFIFVMVVNTYASKYVTILLNDVASIKSIKLIHDMVLVSIIIECVSFTFFTVRSIGLDIKKFDFTSDLSKIELSDSDKEEIEVNINIDVDEQKRKRKLFLRNLKYFYYENKIFFKIGVLAFLTIVIAIILLIVHLNNKIKKEGFEYFGSKYSIKINNSYILDSSYNGELFKDYILIGVNVGLKSNLKNMQININDFDLNIDGAIFKPSTNQSSKIKDIGRIYSNDSLDSDYKDYYLVYKIPNEYVKNKYILRYYSNSGLIEIRLNPKKYISNKINDTKEIEKEIDFSKSLGDIKFKINDYEMKNKFLIEYNYCINNSTNCILSKEYLKASLDENFDKIVLKLNVEYTNKSKLSINSFYELLSEYGSIYYKIGDEWKIQSKNFEQISSKKLLQKNIEYVGVNNEILNATSIKIVFNIRESKYEYILK